MSEAASWLELALYIGLPAVLILSALLRNTFRPRRVATDIEPSMAAALGLTMEDGSYRGELGGRRAFLYRSDGHIVLRILVPEARWMFELEEGAEPVAVDDLVVSWGSTRAALLARPMRAALAHLRRHGAVVAREGELRLHADRTPRPDAAAALVKVADAVAAAPSDLAVASDGDEAPALRERCYQAGLEAGSPEDLALLLDVDVREWRLEAACRLRHAPTLVELLLAGGLDKEVRSRVVLRLPLPLPPAHVERALEAVSRALREGVGRSAQTAASEVLVRHTHRDHVVLLRDVRPSLQGDAGHRVGAHLERLLERDGLGAGQLSMVPVEGAQGAVSLAEAPRHRPGGTKVPEG